MTHLIVYMLLVRLLKIQLLEIEQVGEQKDSVSQLPYHTMFFLVLMLVVMQKVVVIFSLDLMLQQVVLVN